MTDLIQMSEDCSGEMKIDGDLVTSITTIFLHGFYIETGSKRLNLENEEFKTHFKFEE